MSTCARADQLLLLGPWSSEPSRENREKLLQPEKRYNKSTDLEDGLPGLGYVVIGSPPFIYMPFIYRPFGRAPTTRFLRGTEAITMMGFALAKRDDPQSKG